MFKRKIIACLIALSLIAGMLGTPASANTIESSPQTATSLSDNLAAATSDQGITIGLDDSFSEVVTDNQSHEQNTGGNAGGQPADIGGDAVSSSDEVVNSDAGTGEVETISGEPTQEGSLEGTTEEILYRTLPIGEPVLASEPESADEAVSSSSTDGATYVPGPLAGMRPESSAPCAEDGVILDISTQVDVLVNNEASAKTGTGTAAGSNIENDTAGSSKAVALNDAGQPVEPSDAGALADNSVVKAIVNTGTATAATGLADAENTSQDNTATVSSNETVNVDVLGEIIDSNVVVKILYKYWAAITGLADAATGDSDASGLDAVNSIYSDDKAVAKGDAATVNGGGSYDGSALAANESDNIISNEGSAFSASGEANADNTMLGNDILIAPVIDTLIRFCGDIIRSNVTIEIAYNFLAAISGQAVAKSGDACATGADVTNKIDNFTSAKAVGDAPTVSGSGSYSDGSAMAVNDTANTIGNTGEGAAFSGDAEAVNTMVNNDITIAPVVTNALSLLESIVDSNVLIRVTYNIWATISGEAIAETGDAEAAGVAADNSIDNISSATSFGDSAKLSSFGGGSGSADGEACALNTTANAIDNNGAALSISGDATANNTMLDNIVNLSPAIDTVVMVVRPIISEGMVIIDIVYDIWATICGSADAASGGATSYGAFGANAIDSSSEAYAVAAVTIFKPDGSAMALNSSDNNISNDGLGVASSGKVDAASTITNAEVALTGYLGERCYIDETYATPLIVAMGASINEQADGKSGDAVAFGSKADSFMRSNAVSKDIFGSGSFSVNESDADILNTGEAFAITSAVLAQSGKCGSDNSQNKIIIGCGPQEDQAEVAETSPLSISGDTGDEPATISSADAAEEPDDDGVLVSGDNNAGSGSSGGQSGSGAASIKDGAALATYKDNGARWILDSQRWVDGIKPYVHVAKSYIDTVLRGEGALENMEAVKLPWWLWLITASLLAMPVRFVFRLRPKKQ